MEFYKCCLIAVGFIIVLLGFYWFMDWLEYDAPAWVEDVLVLVGASLALAFLIWIATR